jgi:hypothetical protein
MRRLGRWNIVHLIYANLMRRGTCMVDLEGDTAISTVRLYSHDRLCSIVDA